VFLKLIYSTRFEKGALNAVTQKGNTKKFTSGCNETGLKVHAIKHEQAYLSISNFSSENFNDLKNRARFYESKLAMHVKFLPVCCCLYKQVFLHLSLIDWLNRMIEFKAVSRRSWNYNIPSGSTINPSTQNLSHYLKKERHAADLCVPKCSKKDL